MVALGAFARHTARPSSFGLIMRIFSALIALCLLAAGCTPTIPVKDEFGVSALRTNEEIPPEFAAFNRYDWRVNPLLADQMCATPFQTQAIRALAAVPGEILADQARCQTYRPVFWFHGQQVTQYPNP